MKKKFILMLTLLAGVLSANADNVVTIGSADIPKGGQGVIAINLDNTDEIASFQIFVTLPDGFGFVLKEEPVKDKEGNVTGTRQVPVAMTTERTEDLGVDSNVEGQTGKFIVAGMGGTVTGNSGTILYIKVTSDGSQEVASMAEAAIDNIVLSKTGAVKQELAKVSFDVTVEEPGVIIDENYSFIPEESPKGNVIVKRTIIGGEWSTLCLPFDMTETQVKAAFGNDVQLAEFSDYEYNKDENKISLNFDEYDLAAEEGIYGNTPYLIKTSKNISEFSLEAEIYPDEAEAVQSIGKGKNAKKFTGLLHATTVPENSLFISGNKFYYSAGLTKIKAFRGYFTFPDILADGARSIDIDINIDGTTGIKNAVRQLPNDGNYYNLKGQRVEKPSKGVFIVNGKKVVVK
jgi:hypothetical protein